MTNFIRNITAGKYRATLSGRWRGETKKGTAYLALSWKLESGETVTQWLYLTAAARCITERALKVLGMTESDFQEPKAYDWETTFIPHPPERIAIITIAEEEYNGKLALKVKNAQLVEEGSA